ncbi:uncharacterized protein LOC142993166 [Genypterus blacodes]|uniref:uncharacterized protein LOC142993166 n=1 Tax=Genypterus blacodes TaxID=154954 RepID=UPI003F768E3F
MLPTPRYSLGEGGYSRNSIPSGRQITRTPPTIQVKKHLQFCDPDEMDDSVNLEAGAGVHKQLFDVMTPEKSSPSSLIICSGGASKDDPGSMLKGMQGYEPTPADMEFLKKMKEEKLIKKLQGDLAEMQKLFKNEAMALDLSLASKEKAQADLAKFPSREELVQAAKMALEVTMPSAEIAHMDPKSLLASVRKEDVQRAIAAKRKELAQMKKTAETKRKDAVQEREQQERRMVSRRGKIREMMNHLSNLKAELVQVEEDCKAVEMQIGSQEAAEIKEEEAEEEPEPPRSRERSRGTRRKKADKVAETRHKDASEALKMSTKERTKQKSEDAKGKPTKSTKVSKPPGDKVKDRGSDSQDSTKAARGRRKQPESSKTATSERPAPARSRKEAAEAAEEHQAQSLSLRRSKRIACRK